MKSSNPAGTSAAAVAVLTSGVAAGLMYGVSLEAFAAKKLPKQAWILHQQANATVFAPAMPPLSASTLLSVVAAAALSQGRARQWFSAATALTLASYFLTLGKEVPLNKVIAGWNAETAPETWASTRTQWFSNHILRAVPAVLSFGCAVGGLSQRRKA